ncbi:alkaline exonuclease [Murid herpesvirus 3]|uniref:Alkaline exonuclease n=2 Tax=Murid betaherpesvirus 3 TaxID=2560603 RepID=A0A1P8VIX3_9BETA|nr:alkaline exonuclease [Murine roseolovirus]APZ76300.1 alkaline exonuclease [Murid betaherpesvirus 3]AYH64731.1 alkaline exonuclease [Murid herpesvirus 3]
MDNSVNEMFSILGDIPFKTFMLELFLECEERGLPAWCLRITHLYLMLTKYNTVYTAKPFCIELLDFIKFSINDSLLNKQIELDFNNAAPLSSFLMSNELLQLPKLMIVKILKYIERDTRGQSNNPIWHMVRQNSITASKVFNIYLQKKIDIPDSATRYCSDAVNSGLKHEKIIKCMLQKYVTKEDVTHGDNIGLLLDPSSCILGASLDFCSGLGIDNSGLLIMKKKISIYEIKFRHKYLKEKNDPLLINLLTNCSEEAFASFILSHCKPAIDYRTPGSLPAAQEYLMSYNEIYKPIKKLRTCAAPELLLGDIKKQISINEKEKSIVILFGHTEETYTLRGEVLKKLHVFEKKRLTVDVFINPKHKYYYQSILQHYVMTKFFIYDNTDSINDSQNAPELNIVSAIFRKKDPDEFSFVVNDIEYTEEEIPVLLIITPIKIDPFFTSNIITEVYHTWETDIEKSTNLQAWVPNAVREFQDLYSQKVT